MKSSKWSKEDGIQLHQEAPAPAQRITEKDWGVSERMGLISLSDRDSLKFRLFLHSGQASPRKVQENPGTSEK